MATSQRHFNPLKSTASTDPARVNIAIDNAGVTLAATDVTPDNANFPGITSQGNLITLPGRVNAAMQDVTAGLATAGNSALSEENLYLTVTNGTDELDKNSILSALQSGKINEAQAAELMAQVKAKPAALATDDTEDDPAKDGEPFLDGDEAGLMTDAALIAGAGVPFIRLTLLRIANNIRKSLKGEKVVKDAREAERTEEAARDAKKARDAEKAAKTEKDVSETQRTAKDVKKGRTALKAGKDLEKDVGAAAKVRSTEEVLSATRKVVAAGRAMKVARVLEGSLVASAAMELAGPTLVRLAVKASARPGESDEAQKEIAANISAQLFYDDKTRKMFNKGDLAGLGWHRYIEQPLNAIESVDWTALGKKIYNYAENANWDKVKGDLRALGQNCEDVATLFSDPKAQREIGDVLRVAYANGTLAELTGDDKSTLSAKGNGYPSTIPRQVDATVPQPSSGSRRHDKLDIVDDGNRVSVKKPPAHLPALTAGDS